MTTHFFTVDVEEYFQVSAFESISPREEWPNFASRVGPSVDRLLEVMARHGATGTFFVLGWIAKYRPEVVRRIVDAGHEIASHGYWHRRVTTMTPAEFRDDLRASKYALEDLAGAPVVGYRAPSFSIIPGLEWAFDVLIEEGFRYDSSVFPIRPRGYGFPGAPRVPNEIRRASGSLVEFPLATTDFAGLTVPAGGGGYLRQFPFSIIQRAFRESGARGVPSTFYIHPWEIDPEQPRLSVSPLTRIRHYRGLDVAMPRVKQLLTEFRFTSIASFLQRAGDSSPSITALDMA